MSRVNILISTYNGSQFIEEQLESILNQTYSDYHIYIRDDGSTDQTVSKIEWFVKTHGLENRCTLEKGMNIGFALSFQELLRMSSDGEYWAFCDQDDYWYPDKILHAIQWMQLQNPQIPLIYHSGIEIGNTDLSTKTPYRIPVTAGKYRYQYDNMFASNVLFGFAMLINRTLYEELLKVDFHKVKYHDWFASMITVSFGKFHVSEQVDVVHRQHEMNASPFYFLKKIPDGLKLLKGDDFYRRNAEEFYKLYQDRLSLHQKNICQWFFHRGYNIRNAFQKALYPGRWNPQLKVEIVQRTLMILGKI